MIEYQHGILLQYGKSDNVNYTLYDINGDGIKELIAVFHQDPFIDIINIYTYNGTKTQRLFRKEYTYSPDGIRPAGRGIIFQSGCKGTYAVIRIRWDGSKLVDDELMPPSRIDMYDNSERLDSILESESTGNVFDMYDASDYSLLLH